MNRNLSIRFLLLFLIEVVYIQHAFPQTEHNNSKHCEQYCYAHDSDPYLHTSSKTPYEFIYGRNSQNHIVPNCTPVQYWGLLRHGTKLPMKKEIRDMREYMPKLKTEIISNYEIRRSIPQCGQLCQADIDMLREWSWDETITENRSNMITKQGKEDLKGIAKRYRSRFNDLLGKPYSENQYVFEYGHEERTKDSFNAFIDGLFEENAYLVRATNSSQNYDVLEPYDICPAYDASQGNVIVEEQRFEQTDDMKDLVRNISTRLGFTYTLNITTIKIMYNMCRYDRAWNITRLSPWCAVFTRSQMILLEYSEDLQYYYNTGLGNPISVKLGCLTAKDLLEKFEKVASDTANQPTAIIYFSHSLALEMLLATLNFSYDPQPLHGDNFNITDQRQWRLAFLSPFGGNLAAVFYKCDNGEKNVMFFVNEKPVEYDGCKDGLCTWDSVQRRLQQITKSCSRDICTSGGSERHCVMLSVVVLLFVITKIVP